MQPHPQPHPQHRLGIDLGGTKTEAAILAPDGTLAWRQRTPTPKAYADIVQTMASLVQAAHALVGPTTVGVGIPGVLSPATGLVKNANTQILNGHPLDRDLAAAIGQTVRVENDANCFALSEASDGAGQGARCVFGVIIGTGCGGGIAIDGKILPGRHRIAGEWGHTPLPWAEPDELPAPACWCGQSGCLERYLAGPSLAATADAHNVQAILDRAAAGDPAAQHALDRHTDRLARGLAIICNILDPDVIVLGGGLSNMPHLYDAVAPRMASRVFSDTSNTPIRKNLHGDSSGVRGAAWLWPS